MKKPVFRDALPYVRLLTAVWVLVYLSAAQAGEGVLNLQKAVPYKNGINLPPAVKLECDLPKKLAEYTRSYSEDDFAKINVVASPSKGATGRTLIMQIVGIDAAPGGRFTGKKGVDIEGSLWENGKLIGNFQATRYSGGGGGFAHHYKGTCAILARDVKALGKDVAKWLRKPEMNARLGEAK